MIVLAPKPHQEDVDDITEFIWRMCVSYRKLNSITEPFEFPIPRCDAAVTILPIPGGKHVFFISLDAKQGYHQVVVRKCDREKLAFFAPNDKKYTFKVMPFGPTNAPPFYTCMMRDFSDDWNKLMFEILRDTATVDGMPVMVDEHDKVTLGGEPVGLGSKVIIDDILAFSTNLEILLIYLECICRVFQKYRCSFQLKKCEFLKPRVEYVGHDITSEGNCPAASKFDLISKWPLPKQGQSLHSFIGLVNFYHKYHPYMEVTLKPLRLLESQYRRKEIPLMAWSPHLIALFEEVKVILTSSPILARFDKDKPCFLKTDWSALGMAYILMQPDDSEESKQALKKLQDTGVCDFDLTLEGARLRPVAFGSRACTQAESHYHSFVGEVSSGRWSIAQNKRYLWGAFFYWMCDCMAVKEVLDYSGPIHMVRRWTQELLGYSFAVVHRKENMMRDVDSITRMYGKSVGQYVMITQILHCQDAVDRPSAYKTSHFLKHPTRIKGKEVVNRDEVPLLLNEESRDTLLTQSMDTVAPEDPGTGTLLAIASCPIKMVPSPSSSPTGDTLQHAHQQSIMLASSLQVTWLCVDDIVGAFYQWCQRPQSRLHWQVLDVFTRAEHTMMHANPAKGAVIPLQELVQGGQLCKPCLERPVNGADFTFIPYAGMSVDEWLETVTATIAALAKQHGTFAVAAAWVPQTFFNVNHRQKYTDTIAYHLPASWTFAFHHYNGSDFGDIVSTARVCVVFAFDSKQFNGVTDRLAVPEEAQYWDREQRLENAVPSMLDPGKATFIEQHNGERMIPVQLDDDVVEKFEAHSKTSPRLVAVLTTADDGVVSVMDPLFPLQEPDPQFHGQRTYWSAVATTDNDGIWRAKQVTIAEFMHCFGVPDYKRAQVESTQERTVSQLLYAAVGPCLRAEFIMQKLVEGCLGHAWTAEDDMHSDCLHCYVTHSATPAMEWESAYKEDESLRHLLGMVSRKTNVLKCTRADLQKIPSSLHQFVQDGTVEWSGQRLVVRKQMPMMARAIELIVVPKGLQHRIFRHFHASPSGGHAGEYKTLHRLRLRFIWPKMREDIRSWCRSCAECVAAHAWRNRRSELYFSWPVTIPFWVMHVDLWQPGTVEFEGGHGYLLNCMCDLTQFVVSIPTSNTSAENMAQLFTEQVILAFGMCTMVVVDDGSSFKATFKDMCEILRIHLWTLARGNHKGNSCEKYHRYLNKVATIQGAELGTHENFHRIAKTTQYAWNSAPIDDTDVVRSFAAVGRDFRFPIDVDTSKIPPVNSANNNRLFDYLRDVSTDSNFATGVLQILIEERRKRHRDRRNAVLEKSALKVGDVVKAHVQVQSRTDDGVVGKLSYKARGPFSIVRDLGFNSFEVQPYNKPNAATRKYKATELYLLPPQLFPSEPLDTLDQRYINYEHAPVVSPLQQALNVEAYNAEWFDRKAPERKQEGTVNDEPVVMLDKDALSSHDIPSVEEMEKEEPSIVTTPVYKQPEAEVQPRGEMGAEHWAQKIERSKDKLLFIQYTPAGTLRPRWYLAQVDMEFTEDAALTPQQDGRYMCLFLARHPGDHRKSDDRCRWWPDWYQYRKDRNSGEIIFGQRMLFRPGQTPDSTKFIAWADVVDVTKAGVVMVGPFDFQRLSGVHRTPRMVRDEEWQQLYEVCMKRGLSPPTLQGGTRLVPVREGQRGKREEEEQRAPARKRKRYM